MKTKTDLSLTDFRKETRAWLEENCPKSMRKPIKDANDLYWGGRNPKFNSKVVGTILTNIGLESSLNEINIELHRSDVGDKNVYEMMKSIDFLSVLVCDASLQI